MNNNKSLQITKVKRLVNVCVDLLNLINGAASLMAKNSYANYDMNFKCFSAAAQKFNSSNKATIEYFSEEYTEGVIFRGDKTYLSISFLLQEKNYTVI